jgi:hypothetical protein
LWPPTVFRAVKLKSSFYGAREAHVNSGICEPPYSRKLDAIGSSHKDFMRIISNLNAQISVCFAVHTILHAKMKIMGTWCEYGDRGIK